MAWYDYINPFPALASAANEVKNVAMATVDSNYVPPEYKKEAPKGKAALESEMETLRASNATLETIGTVAKHTETGLKVAQTVSDAALVATATVTTGPAGALAAQAAIEARNVATGDGGLINATTEFVQDPSLANATNVAVEGAGFIPGGKAVGATAKLSTQIGTKITTDVLADVAKGQLKDNTGAIIDTAQSGVAVATDYLMGNKPEEKVMPSAPLDSTDSRRTDPIAVVQVPPSTNTAPGAPVAAVATARMPNLNTDNTLATIQGMMSQGGDFSKMLESVMATLGVVGAGRVRDTSAVVLAVSGNNKTQDPDIGIS